MNAIMYYPFALIVLMIWLLGLLTSNTIHGFIEILLMITVVNTVYKKIRGKISFRKKVNRNRIRY